MNNREHTTAQGDTILNNLASLVRTASSGGAITKAKDEVLVLAQTANVIDAAAELLCLGRREHGGCADLLYICSVSLFEDVRYPGSTHTTLRHTGSILGDDHGGESAEGEGEGLHLDRKVALA